VGLTSNKVDLENGNFESRNDYIKFNLPGIEWPYYIPLYSKPHSNSPHVPHTNTQTHTHTREGVCVSWKTPGVIRDYYFEKANFKIVIFEIQVARIHNSWHIRKFLLESKAKKNLWHFHLIEEKLWRKFLFKHFNEGHWDSVCFACTLRPHLFLITFNLLHWILNCFILLQDLMVQVSISSTLYVRIFCTNVIFSS
jgi:hypothetical protein